MNNNQDNQTSLTWHYVEDNLNSLQPVPGGFSQVTKGLLALPDGKQIFVKIGIDEPTYKWTKKEVEIYRFLELHDYKHAPRLLVTNQDDTGFALEALTDTDGWVWDTSWDKDRLEATLSAMSDLAALEISAEERKLLETKALSESDDGWQRIIASQELQDILQKSLSDISRSDLLDLQKIKDFSERSSKFVFRNNTLVHNDIRADNCAWNPVLKQVRLIDWNWAQIGDTRIDTSALLVNIQKSGFDVSAWANKLDKEALFWLAGFWLARASVHALEDGPSKLTKFQFQSGVAALDLANEL